jgi:hypothetical protein
MKYDGVLKAGVLPSGASIIIYTVSGERVTQVFELNGTAVWFGLTQSGNWISPGAYYYRVELKGATLLKGVLIVTAESI